ncbi:MAG: 16S rRNA (uracil(1498)-N(3))-methyltransferase [Firmicutes bacterium]|nr:16S rRNA (uracil(1498)-N(3))-methyltransferase [Bacillota bacterium]
MSRKGARYRFYLPAETLAGEEAVCSGAQVHHAARVLRLRPGDRIEVFDGRGAAYQAAITSIEPSARPEGRMLLRILGSLETRAEPSFEFILHQGLVREAKMDLVIQKAVELGAAGIVPVACLRSSVELSGRRAVQRVERWQSIAVEAARQCGRSRVPPVSPVRFFEEAAVALPPGEPAVLLWEAEEQRGLREVLESLGPAKALAQARLNFFIGPEGGFAPEELEIARRQKMAFASLGPRILRTETAGLATLAAVMYHFGELGR